jgi:hypothetical protein
LATNGDRNLAIDTPRPSMSSLAPGSRRLLHLKGPCGEVSDRQTQNASHDIAYVEE